jgi:hypothetical protein
MDQNLINLGAAAVIVFLILDRFIDFAKIFGVKNGHTNGRCKFDQDKCQKIDQLSVQVAQIHRRLEVTQDLQRVLASIDATLAGNTKILREVADLLDRLNKQHEDDRVK